MIKDQAGQRQIAEGAAVTEAVAARGGVVRLLGGAAIALHSGRADAPHRSFSDLDVVIRRKDAKVLGEVLTERGYEAERRFNALNGDCRLIFHGPTGKLDVFVERFVMCHEIPLSKRLDLDSPTVTVTDLLLTKLQVVELNEKDLQDVCLLLEAHRCDRAEGDCVNLEHLCTLLADDWGLWRTITGSLGTVAAAEPSLRDRVDEILAAVDAAPKGRRFRMRARIGERKRWYELPEEDDA